MGSINIYTKEEYGPIVTNETQAKHIKRRRDLADYYSKDPLHCKLLDIPEELYVRLVRETNRASWYLESNTRERLEAVSAIRMSYNSSELVTESTYFSTVGRYLKPVAEDWIGEPLILCGVFGPRRYVEGSVLLNHIDMQNYIVSITMTIDTKLNKPWPLTYELDNQVIEVNLEPGQMLLYEGRRTPHARPEPLDGEYYTNMYVHYYPAGDNK